MDSNIYNDPEWISKHYRVLDKGVFLIGLHEENNKKQTNKTTSLMLFSNCKDSGISAYFLTFQVCGI